MPNKAKIKGTRVERELVKLANSFGLEAKRFWGSNGEAGGYHAEVDLLIEQFTVQVKARKKIADFMQPTENFNMVILKQDRTDPLIVMDCKLFFELIRELKEWRK